MDSFGEKLKKERKTKKMNLDKMAKDLKTTKATLSRYENNLREPKLEFVKQVADYFDCSADYLLGRTDNRDGIIIYHKVGNDDVELEVSKTAYPDGLTYAEVVEILEKLKEMGFNWASRNV